MTQCQRYSCSRISCNGLWETPLNKEQATIMESKTNRLKLAWKKFRSHGGPQVQQKLRMQVPCCVVGVWAVNRGARKCELLHHLLSFSLTAFQKEKKKKLLHVGTPFAALWALSNYFFASYLPLLSTRVIRNIYHHNYYFSDIKNWQ